MHAKGKTAALSVASTLLLCWSSGPGKTAYAALFNVQYGRAPNYAGSGVLAGSSSWRQFPTAAYNFGNGNDVVDSLGSGDFIHIRTQALNYQPYVYGDYWDTGSTNPTNNGLLAGYFYAFSPDPLHVYLQTIIDGLRPNRSYHVVVYAAGNNAGQGVSISGAVSGRTSGQSRREFLAGVNYVEALRVVSDAAGRIVFDARDIGSSYAVMNGFQIQTNPVLPGDYNLDGFVDAADYTVWADHFGATGLHLLADGNEDGLVDAADYTIWTDHFGQGQVPGPAAGIVPEASAAMLFAPGLLMLSRRRSPV